MSQENAKVVREWISAFPSDPGAFEATLDPDIVWFPFERTTPRPTASKVR